MIAIKDCLPSRLLRSPSDLEVLSIAVGVPVCVTVCVAYVPPGCSTVYAASFLEYIDTLCSTQHLILVGDFNCPDICWPTLSSTASFSPELCDVVFKHNLSQVVHCPTHIKGNTLDVVITDVDDSIHNLHTKLYPEKSDHYLILFDVSLRYLSDTVPSAGSQMVFDFPKADWTTLCSYLYWMQTLVLALTHKMLRQFGLLSN